MISIALCEVKDAGVLETVVSTAVPEVGEVVELKGKNFRVVYRYWATDPHAHVKQLCCVLYVERCEVRKP